MLYELCVFYICQMIFMKNEPQRDKCKQGKGKVQIQGKTGTSFSY